MPAPARRDGPVVVVGAGLAGLAAALRLTRAGVDVELREASDAPGGQVRTDVVDGYRLDRGFQVHNTAYPEAARLLDVDALRLGRYLRGALLVDDDGRHLVADPRQQPTAALGILTAPLGSARDRLALARLAGRLLVEPVERLLAEPELTTARYLRQQGFSPRIVASFFRPFLAGVFLEDALATSSRFFLLTFRCFLRGESTLPADGMGAIPAQLAGLLPAGVLRLNAPVGHLDETRHAAAVLVATDPTTAHRLLPELGTAPPLTSVSTTYHATDTAPVTDPVLLLDATGRTPVLNTSVLTTVVPSYAPPGRHLVSTSVLDPDLPEPAVRQALRRFYGEAAEDLEHLTTVRIPAATPRQPPPLGSLRRPVRIRPAVYVAGAHRDTASTQGALVSGRRAGDAILRDVFDRPPAPTDPRSAA